MAEITKILDVDELRFSSTGTPIDIIDTSDKSRCYITLGNLLHGIYQFSIKKTSGNENSYAVLTFGINNNPNNCYQLQWLANDITYAFNPNDPNNEGFTVRGGGTHEYSIIKLT
jgi:hypothetical protein